MSLEEYKKKTLSQQILDEPDTYVGGTDMIDDVLPVFKDGNIVVENIKYILICVGLEPLNEMHISQIKNLFSHIPKEKIILTVNNKLKIVKVAKIK